MQPVISIVQTRRTRRASMSHDEIITVATAIVLPALLMNSIGIAMVVSAGVRSLARGATRRALRFALVRAR
jgi:hypothetical protein